MREPFHPVPLVLSFGRDERDDTELGRRSEHRELGDDSSADASCSVVADDRETSHAAEVDGDGHVVEMGGGRDERLGVRLEARLRNGQGVGRSVESGGRRCLHGPGAEADGEEIGVVWSTFPDSRAIGNEVDERVQRRVGALGGRSFLRCRLLELCADLCEVVSVALSDLCPSQTHRA